MLSATVSLLASAAQSKEDWNDVAYDSAPFIAGIIAVAAQSTFDAVWKQNYESFYEKKIAMLDRELKFSRNGGGSNDSASSADEESAAIVEVASLRGSSNWAADVAAFMPAAFLTVVGVILVLREYAKGLAPIIGLVFLLLLLRLSTKEAKRKDIESDNIVTRGLSRLQIILVGVNVLGIFVAGLVRLHTSDFSPR